MSNFERDMANTMLYAADARIASLEADKADLLRVLGVADEKIRSGEDARGQYIRENAALEARCRELEAAMSELMGSATALHRADGSILAYQVYVNDMDGRCGREFNIYPPASETGVAK